jgi:hypothetical protein
VHPHIVILLLSFDQSFVSSSTSMTTLLDQIGNTPLVKLNRIFPDAASKQTNILAKLEFQVLIRSSVKLDNPVGNLLFVIWFPTKSFFVGTESWWVSQGSNSEKHDRRG